MVWLLVFEILEMYFFSFDFSFSDALSGFRVDGFFDNVFFIWVLITEEIVGEIEEHVLGFEVNNLGLSGVLESPVIFPLMSNLLCEWVFVI